MLQILRSRGLALALTGILSLGVSLPAWSQTPIETPVVYHLAQQMQTKNIAVVDFDNHTGDASYDNLKRGISESLMTKLARRPELTLVERNQLEKAIKELGFSQSAYADPSGAKQIGKMIGADYLVMGDVVKAGNRFEINVRMIEVATAKVLVSESHSFQSENEILPVVDYLALLIPRKLNLYVSDTELEMARTRLNTNTAQVQADNSWIWWTLGGVVAVGAIIAIIVVATRQTQNITQCVGANCTSDDSSGRLRDRIGTQSTGAGDLNLPLMLF